MSTFASRLKPWAIWLLPLSFFAYQFILRLFPGLVMNDIMQKYNIGAATFGFFASMYYFGYAGMQIPVAALLDRFGPRIVITSFILICSSACLIAVYTDSFALALISRFLIGVGSAVGFLGTSKIISLWFPKAQYAKMVGLTFTFGLIGALYGGKPVSLLIEQFGWEKVFLLLGFVGLVLALVVFSFVKNSNNFNKNDYQPVAKSLFNICKNKNIWLIAFANLLMVGSLEGFADVWGVTYLMKTRGLDKEAAALVTSCIFLGMLFGGPLLASIADKFKAYYTTTAMCGVIISLIFTILLMFNQYIPDLVLYAMMFVTGILCCYQVLVFAIGSNTVSLQLMGITIAFLNCINMFGGSFFHTTIGLLMDYAWDGTLMNDVPVYDTQAFAFGLSAIPVASLIGALVFFCLRPKKALNKEASTEFATQST